LKKKSKGNTPKKEQGKMARKGLEARDSRQTSRYFSSGLPTDDDLEKLDPSSWATEREWTHVSISSILTECLMRNSNVIMAGLHPRSPDLLPTFYLKTKRPEDATQGKQAYHDQLILDALTICRQEIACLKEQFIEQLATRVQPMPVLEPTISPVELLDFSPVGTHAAAATYLPTATADATYSPMAIRYRDLDI